MNSTDSKKKKGGLGAFSKGINPSKLSTKGVSPFSSLPLSQVYPNPNQPRKIFNNVEELGASIKQNGQLQPIVVVKRDKKYMIVAGERRYRATLWLQRKTISAKIVEMTDEEIQVVSLLENIQREDLTPYETAVSVVGLLKLNPKVSAVATQISKAESYVSKCKKVLKLDEDIIELIIKNKDDIGIEKMYELSRIKDSEEQKMLYYDEATVQDIRTHIRIDKEMQQEAKAYDYQKKKLTTKERLDKYYPVEEAKKISSTKKMIIQKEIVVTDDAGFLFINGFYAEIFLKQILHTDKKYKITIEEK